MGMGNVVLKKTKNLNGNYSCDELDITVEEWKSILQAVSVSDNYRLWLARFYHEPGHKASCKHMGEKFNCNPQSPNSIVTNFGKAVQKILHRFEVRGTDNEPTYWIIPMKSGRYVDGYFEWTMRDELIQAMEELDMTSPEQFAGNAWGKDENSQGGPTMPQDKTLVEKCTKLLENTRNLILTGAPGTGKTYLAKQIAGEMGCKPDEIGFVQFHPSYDYTDFVEGLRPVQDESGSGQIGFERKDGVFKEFCARALQNLVDSRKSVDVLQHERSINEIIADFLDGAIEKKTQFETITKNIFFVDSFNDKKIFVSIPQNEKVKNLQIQIDDILELISNNVQLNNGKAVSEYFKRKWRTQHDSYIFSLTKKIQESMENTGNNQTTAVKKIQLKKFVFIIDEINRGEVAKIFGELFYSIDPGYRVTAGDLEAMKAGKKGLVAIRTQYANLELTGNEFDRALGASDYGHFFVPENVYIIGTMNDIDRSVESMDFAFRRRFAWAEVEAIDTVDMLDTLPQVWAEEAKERMKKLNDAISETQDFGPAYHIGASYFLKLNQYEGNFDDLWKYHIKGILEEYVRGNPRKEEVMTKFKSAYSDGTTE